MAGAPAAAFHKRPRKDKTQTPDLKQRQEIDAHEAAAQAQQEAQPLSGKEMANLRGSGYRNSQYNGILPWQRSLRDVNLNNGNLFKSFTDIQVAPARGAGLAWQRMYNSNDDRVGPFGVGWTHAYDIRMEEAGGNLAERTDFFGGKHEYTRDADGLYSPPAYLFDELSSQYDDFLANGPADVLSDDQRGMDGTVKHFVKNGTSGERVCDYIEDRPGNRTELTYGLSIGDRNLLTRVTDSSGRYLDITWSDVDATSGVAWRITQVEGPIDPTTSDPVYTVSYEYNSSFNLWKVHQDPYDLDRVTTYTYTTVSGEAGLLASIADPLGHTVSYTYGTTINWGGSPGATPTGTVWVTSITEPGSGGNHVWWIEAQGPGFDGSIDTVAGSNALPWVYYQTDGYLRVSGMSMSQASGIAYFYYDSANNVTEAFQNGPSYLSGGTDSAYPANHIRLATYGPHGNVLTEEWYGYPNSTTTYTYYPASKYFQKESVEDPNGNVTTFDYYSSTDSNPGNRGNAMWVRDARYGTTGEQLEYTYNSYGQKLTESAYLSAISVDEGFTLQRW